MSDQHDTIRRVAKAALSELRSATSTDGMVHAASRLYRVAASEGFSEAVGADGEKAILRSLQEKVMERAERKVTAAATTVSETQQRIREDPSELIEERIGLTFSDV